MVDADDAAEDEEYDPQDEDEAAAEFTLSRGRPSGSRSSTWRRWSTWPFSSSCSSS